MRMTTSHPRIEPKTRFIFRVLAGVLAFFLLAVGLPAVTLEAMRGSPQAWIGAMCCFLAGVGLAVGARTGRWPFTFGTPA